MQYHLLGAHPLSPFQRLFRGGNAVSELGYLILMGAEPLQVDIACIINEPSAVISDFVRREASTNIKRGHRPGSFMVLRFSNKRGMQQPRKAP